MSQWFHPKQRYPPLDNRHAYVCLNQSAKSSNVEVVDPTTNYLLPKTKILSFEFGRSLDLSCCIDFTCWCGVSYTIFRTSRVRSVHWMLFEIFLTYQLSSNKLNLAHKAFILLQNTVIGIFLNELTINNNQHCYFWTCMQ